MRETNHIFKRKLQDEAKESEEEENGEVEYTRIQRVQVEDEAMRKKRMEKENTQEYKKINGDYKRRRRRGKGEQERINENIQGWKQSKKRK